MGLQSHPRPMNAEPVFKNWVDQFQVNSGYNERECDRGILKCVRMYYVYAYIYVFAYIRVRMYAHIRVRVVYVYMCTCTYTRTCI